MSLSDEINQEIEENGEEAGFQRWAQSLRRFRPEREVGTSFYNGGEHRWSFGREEES